MQGNLYWLKLSMIYTKLGDYIFDGWSYSAFSADRQCFQRRETLDTLNKGHMEGNPDLSFI